jgi:hypothetical protein
MEQEGTLTFVTCDFRQPMRRVCDLWGVHEDQSKVSSEMQLMSSAVQSLSV